MRVIAGEQKGRRLVTPEGLHTRPTSDKVKEALFSIIQFDLADACFLDLFSGSGQMGIEALSRGAKRSVFVDMDKKAIDCINKNLKETGYTNKSYVHYGDVGGFLMSTKEKFDIVFLDPPYREDLINPIFEKVTEVCKKNAIIICEVLEKQPLAENVNGFSLKRRYRYGKTELALYRCSEAETEIY